MAWWIWILIGLGLLAAEVAIPGGITMLFFGVSAVVVGMLVALGLGGPLWLQALLFATLSIVSLLSLRGPILRRMNARRPSAQEIDSLVGKAVLLKGEIQPGAEGAAELRGTTWTARNCGDVALAAGHQATIERVDGLKLLVR
jgi:membrane protein implicated in regulation of membrane protease activity